jgi:ribosome biogenesis GTPase A
LANVGGAVRLVSCKTGFGVNALLQTARELAEEMDCDIYLIGAANAGKSTLINRITSNMAAAAPNDDLKTPQANDRGIKTRPGNVNAKKGLVTTSPLPGTTLKFIKFDLGDGKNLFDTPGEMFLSELTYDNHCVFPPWTLFNK